MRVGISPARDERVENPDLLVRDGFRKYVRDASARLGEGFPPGALLGGPHIRAHRVAAAIAPLHCAENTSEFCFTHSNMRRTQVEYAPKHDAAGMLGFYMGKNTPERKDYIMENLVVAVEE